MPFDLSEIANDPDLGEAVTVIRSKGVFGLGGYKAQTTNIDTWGILTVADSKALQQVPEGDRVTGAMQLITQMQLNQTSEQRDGVSDKIMWRGSTYQILSVAPWSDFGFSSAILQRLTGS